MALGRASVRRALHFLPPKLRAPCHDFLRSHTSCSQVFGIVTGTAPRGRFRFVEQVAPDEPCVEMDGAELSLILEGIDLSGAKRRKKMATIKKGSLTPCADDHEWIDESLRGSRGSFLSLAR
jgi:hypothetical protein